MRERRETVIRLVMMFVYGVILEVLGIIATFVWIAQFFYVLIFGKRHKGMAEFYNKFASYYYRVERYIGFATNERPGIMEFFELEPVDILEGGKNEEHCDACDDDNVKY